MHIYRVAQVVFITILALLCACSQRKLLMKRDANGIFAMPSSWHRKYAIASCICPGMSNYSSTYSCTCISFMKNGNCMVSNFARTHEVPVPQCGMVMAGTIPKSPVSQCDLALPIANPRKIVHELLYIYLKWLHKHNDIRQHVRRCRLLAARHCML